QVSDQACRIQPRPDPEGLFDDFPQAGLQDSGIPPSRALAQEKLGVSWLFRTGHHPRLSCAWAKPGFAWRSPSREVRNPPRVPAIIRTFSAMGCLDEQTVVAFVHGALTGRKLVDAEKHLLGCPDCSTLVALAAPAPRQVTLKGPGAPHTREVPETPPSRGVPSPSPDLTTAPLPTWGESHSDGSIVDVSSADVPRPGGTVGRYHLIQLVGRGGMGEVYAAHDPELDRKIAIKI